MRPILTSAQKAAAALRRAETVLRNWQDEPDSPRKDVNEMLRLVAEMRALVQGHVLEDVERAHDPGPLGRNTTSFPTAHARETTLAETPEMYDHQPRADE